MRTIYHLEEMSDAAAAWKAEGRSLGLVHFQGGLHRGHASLLKAAKAENDGAVLCLFALDGRSVADPALDARKAEASGADILFIPSRNDFWPTQLMSRVAFDDLATRLAGSGRPHYYRDLCTLALKLFHLIRPDRTYYGQKDIQRFLLVRRMTADLNMPVDVQCLPIIREQDNLALSGNNALLDPNQRKQAGLMFSALQLAEQLYAGGQRDAAAILGAMEQELRKALLGNILYLQAVDMVNLLPQQRLKAGSLISLALTFGDIVLCDNTILS